MSEGQDLSLISQRRSCTAQKSDKKAKEVSLSQENVKIKNATYLIRDNYWKWVEWCIYHIKNFWVASLKNFRKNVPASRKTGFTKIETNKPEIFKNKKNWTSKQYLCSGKWADNNRANSIWAETIKHSVTRNCKSSKNIHAQTSAWESYFIRNTQVAIWDND